MGNRAQVEIEGEQNLIDLPGKWRLKSRGQRPLAPGDIVEVKADQHGWRIESRLPRKNEFIRRLPARQKPIPQVIAVNLDLVLIVVLMELMIL